MTFNESDHPRVPAGSSSGGQFTSKVVDAAREAAFDTGGSGLSSHQVDMATADFNRQIRKQAQNEGDEWLTYEKAWIYDSEGEKVLSQNGDEAQVEFSDEFLESRKTIKGTLIHNHPSNGFLSYQDLAFGLMYGLKNIVAVTEDGYYIATTRDTLRGSELDEAVDVIKNVWSDTNDKVYKSNWSDIVSGVIDASEAPAIHYKKMLGQMGTNPEIMKYYLPIYFKAIRSE